MQTSVDCVTRFVRHHAREGSNDGMTSESVKLTNAGTVGALRVAGFIVSDDDTFASSIRFYDTKKTVQPNLYAVNLRLKKCDASDGFEEHQRHSDFGTAAILFRRWRTR